MRTSCIPPPLWTLIVATAMWALDHYVPVTLLFPIPWGRIGYGIIALSPIAPLAAVVQFRRARTTVNPHHPEAANTLVTHGVYAVTRNPMYLGLAVALLGWALVLGTLTPLAGPGLFVLIIERVQIRPEEHALYRRFGEPYAQYCLQVHRWLGRRRSL